MKKLLPISLIVAVSIAAGYVITNINNQPPSQPASQQTVEQTNNKTLSYKGENGKNALQLLKTHADVKTDSTDFGELVTSINGVKSTDNEFWAFYINDKLSEVGAGDYQTTDNDTITWRLE